MYTLGELPGEIVVHGITLELEDCDGIAREDVGSRDSVECVVATIKASKRKVIYVRISCLRMTFRSMSVNLTFAHHYEYE